jgi:hypothetical protein
MLRYRTHLTYTYYVASLQPVVPSQKEIILKFLEINSRD